MKINSNKKEINCNCYQFEIINNEIVCKNCKKPLKQIIKPISKKGKRYKK